jgi:Sec-independent protein translocase protein TatA
VIWEWLIVLVIALFVFGPMILKARKNADDDQ